MTEKERLIELIDCAVEHYAFIKRENLADYLLSHGVKLSATPCDFCEYSNTDKYPYDRPCNMCKAKPKEE